MWQKVLNISNNVNTNTMHIIQVLCYMFSKIHKYHNYFFFLNLSDLINAYTRHKSCFYSATKNSFTAVRMVKSTTIQPLSLNIPSTFWYCSHLFSVGEFLPVLGSLCTIPRFFFSGWNESIIELVQSVIKTTTYHLDITF